MRGYSRAELHQHDEEFGDYEEDGEDQEGEAEEEYEEEEDPKPTKEELEYLKLRQKLKESLRKKIKKESSSVPTQVQEKKKLPYDNYGSFFGPSQPVIAQRVIQESKSILENQHLASRFSSLHHAAQNKKSPTPTASGTKPAVREEPPKIVSELQKKVQKLKDTRDYSFLLSDDAEFPAPTKEPPPRNVSVPDARSTQVPLKSKQLVNKPSRPVSNGHEERKPVSMNHKMPPKAGVQKVAPPSRPKSTSTDPRRELGSNSGNGPGRPVGPKGLPSKMPVPTVEKKASAVGAKSSQSGVQKAPLPKLHPPVQKQHSEQKFREPERNKIKAPKQIPVRASMQEQRPKKKPVKRYSDEEDEDEGDQAISMIRKMFGYNPNKYTGRDEDDSDMEANFDDIQREERKSAKIAREEDERELRLIEEEERRERLRKLKKRKLRQ
ncbi:PREDICTED: protein SPT2 homolog isoform X2 [Nelumbo nucifera]|uniref:Protein SPT2 homolog isoform X2 n=2 Tax=Nelumbo nucifera TaxID=4432 RepID=A0A1U8B3Y4_NELNU|nr:PREDICTED: protein SPT2 homolog isoform X2 [Nelumbo nucifera]DAD22282.1 TPA_asm: hypothetical protein HUJ06_023745 [Nelumbo nucifera]